MERRRTAAASNEISDLELRARRVAKAVFVREAEGRATTIFLLRQTTVRDVTRARKCTPTADTLATTSKLRNAGPVSVGANISASGTISNLNATPGGRVLVTHQPNLEARDTTAATTATIAVSPTAVVMADSGTSISAQNKDFLTQVVQAPVAATTNIQSTTTDNSGAARRGITTRTDLGTVNDLCHAS